MLSRRDLMRVTGVGALATALGLDAMTAGEARAEPGRARTVLVVTDEQRVEVLDRTES